MTHQITQKRIELLETIWQYNVICVKHFKLLTKHSRYKGLAIVAKEVEQLNEAMEASITDFKSTPNPKKHTTSLFSVIQKIADQTNLLALNTAIEAARAQNNFAAAYAEVIRVLSENAQNIMDDLDDEQESISRLKFEDTKNSIGHFLSLNAEDYLPSKSSWGKFLSYF